MNKDKEYTFSLKKYQDCSKQEISDFSHLVLKGGEIVEHGFSTRLKNNSKLLGFVWFENSQVSVAAIKLPIPSYHRNVFKDSGVSNLAPEYPLEYGWAYTKIDFRRKNLAYKLAKMLLNSFTEKNVYATVATSNIGSFRLLSKLGFMKIGDPYPGQSRNIQLFLKNN